MKHLILLFIFSSHLAFARDKVEIKIDYSRSADIFEVMDNVTNWWPPIDRSNASPTGNYLIMRYNPTIHKDRNESDVVSHEIVHTISARQTLEQKKSLTQKFLKKCAVQDHLKKLTILEEPLAVVFGQLLFSEQFHPDKCSLADNLYNNPWINSFSRILFSPLKRRFEKGESITQGAVEDAAALCVDLENVASLLK